MMRLANGETILFVGDSITDCGRTRDQGPFGAGYVGMLRSMVMARNPDLSVRFVNQGIGGNTIRDLVWRWETDVLAENPDHLFVMIGINDVWRRFAAAEQQPFHVPVREFLDSYADLIRRSRQAGLRRIHACGCFFVEPDRDEPMRKMCDEYNAATRDAADRASIPFIDMQAEFDHLLKYQHPMVIAADRVHPNPHGHLVIAERLYRFLTEL